MSNYQEDLKLIEQYFNDPNSVEEDSIVIQYLEKALTSYELGSLNILNEKEFEEYKNRLKQKFKDKLTSKNICIETQEKIISFIDNGKVGNKSIIDEIISRK